MTAEKARKTPFEEAAELGERLRKMAEETGEAEVTAPSWLAALISFSKEDLEERGMAMITEDGQTRIVVSEKGLPLIKSVLIWMSKSEKEQRAIKATLYPSLFRIIQASRTPAVKLTQVVQSERKLLALKDSIPSLGEIIDYLMEGGELTDKDKDELTGIASSIFSELRDTGDFHVEKWERDAMSPEFLSVIPDE